jgi:very-short-patch-repair endonuclease
MFNKKMEEEQIEFIIEDESEEIELSKNKCEKELTTYSYISKGTYIFFEYFVGYEISALLGYKDTNKTIRKNVSKSNQLIFRDYPGEKVPLLDPRTILITREGAIEILIKTRKSLSPDVLHILKTFNIDTTNRKCLTKEQQTLSSITNVFKTENFDDQYKIGKYYLDLYFKDYKIVIECDENGHSDRKPHKERERMDFVNETLGITDSNWIRFNPDEHNFDVLKVIGQIYRKMDEIKDSREGVENNKTIDEEKYLKLLEEKSNEYLKLLEDNKRKEEEYLKLLEELKQNKPSSKKKSDSLLINEKKCAECNEISKTTNFFFVDREKRIFFDSCISCYEKEHGDSKQCTLCEKIKEKYNFVVDTSKKDGLTYECKECRYEQNKKRKEEIRRENPNIGKLKCETCQEFQDLKMFYKMIDNKYYVKECKTCYCEKHGESKQCFTCKEIKVLSEYDKTAANVDGLACYCKTCRKAKRDKEKDERKSKEDPNKNKKQCAKCETYQEYDLFFRNFLDDGKTTYYDDCSSCNKPNHMQCGNCHEIKQTDCFSKDSTRKRGYRTTCKECRRK